MIKMQAAQGVHGNDERSKRTGGAVNVCTCFLFLFHRRRIPLTGKSRTFTQ